MNALFITSTAGLDCNGHGLVAKLVRIEYYRNPDQSVTLKSVNGRSGGQFKIAKVVTIGADKFSDRPRDPYDSTKEAIWALHTCGWRLMTEDYDDARARELYEY